MSSSCVEPAVPSILPYPYRTEPMRLLTTLSCLFAVLTAHAQPGTTCADAIPVAPGTHTAPFDNAWYVYTAPGTGQYTLSTCGLSDCDTKLWAYTYCTGLVTNEQGLNALGYNDDACGLQTNVVLNLTGGQVIYIRVGDYQNACAGDTVVWSLAANVAPPAPACGPGQAPVQLNVVPDAYPNEMSWDLRNGSGTVLASGTSAGAALCVDTGTCLVFSMHDTYGDGIFAPGGFWVYYDGALIGQGGNFDFHDRVEWNCPPGFSCLSPATVGLGQYSTPGDEGWYAFVPDSNGVYTISTCGTATCDTRIWVYDHCEGLNWDDTNIGTIYYDDNSGGCGLQAQVQALLEAGTTYYIRIGDTGVDCAGGPIAWSLDYAGPIVGCTDPTACNYDPLATVSDGSCIPWGDPACPLGPDLIVRSDVLQNSIYAQTMVVNANDCYIQEGCLAGFGTRELIRFTTHIQNIGFMDYYIGNPGANPDQFVYGVCHNHWHYEGYAEYLLYDSTGQQTAQGFKNGFCVMDLECSGGGSAQYGCSNMGISMGCGDIYSSGLSCQWIDITDVPDGRYTLVVRTNWDNTPDALGRQEMDINNNWGQACVNIVRNPNLSVTVQQNCPSYVDCLGEIYGDAQFDCEGVCAGTRLIGDLDVDADNDSLDAAAYVAGILDASLAAAPCTDVNDDGLLTVADAAMIAHCHQANQLADSALIDTRCGFPLLDMVNIYDSVTFTIGAFDMGAGYLDVHVRNPNRKLVGYELRFSGITITGVDNLADPADFPIVPAFNGATAHVIGLSYVDSLLERSNVFVPLFRVHFTNPAATVCIDEVVDVVNEDYAVSLTFLQDPCVAITEVASLSPADGVSVAPSPFVDHLVVTHAPRSGRVVFTLMDLQGRVVRRSEAPASGQLRVDGRDLASGTYLYRLEGAINASGRVVKR